MDLKGFGGLMMSCWGGNWGGWVGGADGVEVKRGEETGVVYIYIVYHIYIY